MNLWAFRLDIDDALLPQAERLLDEEERARATRFRFDEHRRRFIVRRAVRRCLLAQQLQCRPEQLRYDVDAFGKPFVQDRDILHFNASHSDDIGVLITADVPIGIDVEAQTRQLDYVNFAQHSFTSTEADEITGQPDAMLANAFFCCWTAKEAYVKAIGKGLRKSLKSFAVRCAPDERPALLWDDDLNESAASWTLRRARYLDNILTIAIPTKIANHFAAVATLDAQSVIAGDPDAKATDAQWLIE